MSDVLVNADFNKRIVIDALTLPWVPSPQVGVERRMLDRIGGEVARATSLVRYAPARDFPAHGHALGEEFLVLDGVFSDEYGDYPAGTYVRNPPGSAHRPRTVPGCTIFVKLRQMSLLETARVVIDTRASVWQVASDGIERIALHTSPGETVALERLAPGAKVSEGRPTGGEEIFVLSGDLADEEGAYGPATWIRSPDGYPGALRSRHGSTYWVKRGHLRPGT